ncbi:MAG: ribulose-phosphate 3-epimerase [Candidatus Thermoplasmatota archaeon]|nr:ribulose-phosphate 3-epimerase [Candidatus Thermoplasmatota archaeon]MCL5989306.1 ribulose-phosphate 3-epimerase [Candidatus Thermoplasmatota archaeon]
MKVSPSLISSRLEQLENQILECDSAGAYSYHVDVMDGHFVPNITVGPDFVKAVRRSTTKPIEVHLMIERPDHYYKSFIDAGADILTVHSECLINFADLNKKIYAEGKKMGIAVNPETQISDILPDFYGAELLVIMSVHPGFSYQKFLDYVKPKISESRQIIDSRNLGIQIEIDGGVNDVTGSECAKLGADILVSASYIFSNGIKEPIQKLKSLQRV